MPVVPATKKARTVAILIMTCRSGRSLSLMRVSAFSNRWTLCAVLPSSSRTIATLSSASSRPLTRAACIFFQFFAKKSKVQSFATCHVESAAASGITLTLPMCATYSTRQKNLLLSLPSAKRTSVDSVTFALDWQQNTYAYHIITGW